MKCQASELAQSGYNSRAWFITTLRTASPQVARGGNGIQMWEGSCVYTEQAVTDSQQWVVLQREGWAGG